MFKKILISIFIISVLGIIGGIVYWAVNKKEGENFTPGNVLNTLFPFAAEMEEGNNNLPPLSGDSNLPSMFGGRLVQIASGVSGASFSSTTLFYVEKSTGHIYKLDSNGQNKVRVSNTTMLKIFEIKWPNNTGNFIAKYFGDEWENIGYNFNQNVKIILAQFKNSTSTPEEGKIEGIFLPDSILGAAMSPKGDRVFYLASENTQGVADGIIADFKNQKPKAVLSLPFDEFEINWPAENMITLLTKPSIQAEGYLYSFDPNKNKFGKILGGFKGFTALVSPDGKKVLYSYSSTGINTKIYNLENKTEVYFGLGTLPEKCVWGLKNRVYCAVPSATLFGNYLDSWYQGQVSYDDAVWSVDIETGQVSKITEQTGMDIIKPFLSDNENYLFFINKKNNSLWSLNLGN